jgi:hypothetical protein
MEYDNEALKRRREELLGLVRKAIPASSPTSSGIAEFLLESFMDLTPPTKPELLLEWLTIRPSGLGGGRSRKPGNIWLNWRKLMDVIPDITIAAVGGATAPKWLIPFLALYVWNKLWSSSTEEFGEVEATVIYALWKHRNGESRISEDDGYASANALREKIGLPLLVRKDFDRAVNRLLGMKCIEIDKGVIWLREWVRIQY